MRVREGGREGVRERARASERPEEGVCFFSITAASAGGEGCNQFHREEEEKAQVDKKEERGVKLGAATAQEHL